MTIKKAVRTLHLWLGLGSGLIVLFLGITGCILAFQKEIETLTNPYQYVKAENKAFVPPSVLGRIASGELPSKKAHSVTYGGRTTAAQIAFYNADPDYYYIVFLNPYNGQVLKVKNMDRDFFRVVIMGHYYLWLPPSIGQPIVASATLVFFLMLVTGLILWWPKNKAARKQRFSVKWNARWARVNYDLHNVLGFYITWVMIFIALSGLVMGFQWFSKAVYWTASGGNTLVAFSEPTSAGWADAGSTAIPAVDRVWYKMTKEHSRSELIEVHFPETDSSAIGAGANPDADTYWKTDYRYFDQYSLEELSVNHIYGRFANSGTAGKLMRMNYDLHVGAIGGLPTKILAFIASLIAASLPVTGFLVWQGKRKRRRVSKRPVLVASASATC